MIKPEDITPDAKYDVMRYLIAVGDADELNAYAGSPPQSIESQIAGILNVLIDAGIVSPPCWAIIAEKDSDLYREHAGYLSHGEQVNPLAIAETEDVARHMQREHYRRNKSARVEHWKGQRE